MKRLFLHILYTLFIYAFLISLPISLIYALTFLHAAAIIALWDYIKFEAGVN